jgi:hypothetical protein
MQQYKPVSITQVLNKAEEWEGNGIIDSHSVSVTFVYVQIFYSLK